MTKLRPSTKPDRALVIPFEAMLAPQQVILLLVANGFRFDDLDVPRPKLSNHSEVTHTTDEDVWEQWDREGLLFA